MTPDSPNPDFSSRFPVRLDQLVVGLDGSPESLHALDLAATIGAAHHSTLTVVHVHQTPPVLAFSVAGSAEHERTMIELDEVVKASADERLAGYPGQWVVASRRGNVAQELMAAADEVDADLIVVGHRSHGSIRDAILGSVAAGTVHRSHRSVLVALPPGAEV